MSLNKLHLSYGKYIPCGDPKRIPKGIPLGIEVLDSDTNTTKTYESSYKVATSPVSRIPIPIPYPDRDRDRDTGEVLGLPIKPSKARVV